MGGVLRHSLEAMQSFSGRHGPSNPDWQANASRGASPESRAVQIGWFG